MTKRSRILFVGDSITHGTDWSKRIYFAEVNNIAVPGYSTDDITFQLTEIIKIKPQIISLLIGTNDFGNVLLDRTGEEVGQRVITNIEAITSALPDVKLVANSILPRGLAFTNRIRIANIAISELLNKQVTYLDVWPALSKDNFLNPMYLLEDGFDVHLNEDGYDAWAGQLIPVLKSL